MSAIVGVHAREILDSRGNPTVEVEVGLETGEIARAGVPSGASTGTFEAVELRDGGGRYGGKGVLNAVKNVNDVIAPEICGMDADDLRAVDRVMLDLDGTSNKSRLGANAILGVSMAVTRAAALEHDMALWDYIGGLNAKTLPTPMMNVINGGAHADNNLDIQEFMIVPHGAESFCEALRMGAETYHALKKLLVKEGFSTGLGDEGGFAPNFSSNRMGFEYLVKAIEAAGYEPGRQISIACDVAISELYSEGKYRFKGEGSDFTPAELADYYAQLCADFPIVSIEDGMNEEDWEGWQSAARRRRSFRHQSRTSRQRHRDRRGQLDPDQAESDRFRFRDARRHRHGSRLRLQLGRLAPLRRDRRQLHRRSGGGDCGRTDQDGGPRPHGPYRQVQPAAPHRGGAGGRSFLRRAVHLPLRQMKRT